MNGFLQYLEISSHLQLIVILVVSLSVYIMNLDYSYWQTKDIRTAPLSIVSALSVNLIFWGLVIINREYELVAKPTSWEVALIIANLINLSNIGILTVEYLRERRNKVFDEDRITRYHFNSTLNSFIVIILLTISFTLFASASLTSTLILATVPALLSIWINHLAARKLLIDDDTH